MADLSNEEAASILASLDLGSTIAETDDLLESARVETSVFDDLIGDRVDLIPGTKGSGKSALYRIFVDFLPDMMLGSRRVVIAHGVQERQDSLFQAFKKQFDALTEAEFLDFWCIYLISLANEQFIKNIRFSAQLRGFNQELTEFKNAYYAARIPDFDRPKTLKETLGWVLNVLGQVRPKITWKPPGEQGEFEFTVEAEQKESHSKSDRGTAKLPTQVEPLVTALSALLVRTDLSLWLMVDKLDELFERRSETERKALRAILRAMRLFGGKRIRLKVFLRDDILEHIVRDEGFTALTHVTARKSDTLRWSEDQILTMTVKRLAANPGIRGYCQIELDRIMASSEYREQIFYRVFADTVYRPPQQSRTLRWLYNHCKDGRGVVTPRDVIELVNRASQKQRDLFRKDPSGTTQRLIHGPAIVYGLEELSRAKRVNYLEAEFPHKWHDIRRLVGGGTEYSHSALKRIFGKTAERVVDDLVSMGVLSRGTRQGEPAYKVPFLYRRGLECTQKFVS